jgi:pimeloyl-ACP methyl ester carboxylesterase
VRHLRLIASATATVAFVGCSASGAAHKPSQAEATDSAPQLTGRAPCPGTQGFSCATLRVPLDHSHQAPGTLDLKVALADNKDAPRGILLVLAGGPGQPGVSLANRVKQFFDPMVLQQYRMVMFDQRGTGPSGINCVELQAAVGGADFQTPPREATEDCSRQLGVSRSLYGTPDTVQDIDLLRQALGVRQLTVDGVSYGTFVGEHYALRHPDQVRSLVLDSVVPHRGFDPFADEEMAATKRVLAYTCSQQPSCTTNPVDDLAWLVRHGEIDGQPIDGTNFLEGFAIYSLNSFNPTQSGVPAMLNAARHGDTAQLKEFFASTTGAGTPYDQLSAGLHMATLCSDLRFPWGTSAAPLAGREAALDRAVSELRERDLYPYDVATARNTLPIQGCLRWEPARPSADSNQQLIKPPTLIVHGENDLFCPVEWAHWERSHTENGELLVVPGSGHSLQGSRTDPTARNKVRTFLLR